MKQKSCSFILVSLQPIDPRAEHLCVHWEGSEEGGSWSTKGCSHMYTNDSYTICKCFQLSSFAVLMALSLEVSNLTGLSNKHDITSIYVYKRYPERIS